jgi:hypothetical protein
MMTGILHLHSFLRYVAVFLIIWTIVHAFMNMKKKEAAPSKWSMLSMLVVHTQFILGLILWFQKFSAVSGTPEMKLPENRYFIMEHSMMMLIAIALITLGHIKGKRAADSATRYKTIFRFFLIGFIIMMAMIPWPFLSFAPVRGWF